MEETIWDVSAVKDWLIEYREKERDIDNQIERLERFIIKMTSVGAQVISGMPQAPGTAEDRIGGLVARKEELEGTIRSDVRKLGEKRKAVEGVLAQLKRSDERAVIRMRYIDRESWNTVAELMFGSRDDYEGKEDTYLRRVHKVHGAALQNMARIMSEDPNMPAPEAQ